MKKTIFTILLAYILLTAGTLQAQVTIGADTPPDASAVLELSSNSKGLLPTRLTTAQRNTITSPAVGLLIFNTDTQRFNFYTSAGWKSVVTAPTAPTATAAKAIAVSATSTTLNGTVNANGSTTTSLVFEYGLTTSYGASTPELTAAVSGTTATAINATITGLTIGKIYHYRIKATNGVGTTYSANRTFHSCGAFVASGQWKEFMCHNLGATTALDPMTYSDGITGDFYQWGRPADGHQIRTSTTTTILSTTDVPGHGNFITNTDDWRSPHNDNLWTDNTKAPNDPCPIGFKVPTQAQWAGVANTSLNTLGTWATGYKFGTSLFLPASGFRRKDGTTYPTGEFGDYLSSTVTGIYVYVLNFANVYVRPAWYDTRGYGTNVRCIAE